MTASRRQFLASAATVTTMPHLFAAGSDTIRVGLVGCGSRGTGAVIDALTADANARLVAMADVFPDRLDESLKALRAKPGVADRVNVGADAQFLGFEAYQQILPLCDVVILATPPQFRPAHLRAAVEAGKHVFAEKPCAVDAPGVRSVLESTALAAKKGLSIVSGLCLRYDAGFGECVKRIRDGAVGPVVALFANDYRGGRWAKVRQPGWSDLTYQMRNWYNFTWLSGDFNVEQHVHFLDVCAWVMGDQYPVRAVGMGGRSVLTGPEYGNIYDHFSVIYEYENGVRLVSNCRQHPRTKADISAVVLGARGRALLSERDGGLRITGATDWSFEGPGNQMYVAEHQALFAAIRSGRPVNNGEYMAKSTLLAIMGRMAAYTGQQVTWKAALESQEDLSPPHWDWDAKLPEPSVAVPGVTRLR